MMMMMVMMVMMVMMMIMMVIMVVGEVLRLDRYSIAILTAGGITDVI
jgi:hypothetical protein